MIFNLLMLGAGEENVFLGCIAYDENELPCSLGI
jgi:hypothetical protein